MTLSKSEYMMFLKHPAWLWLKKHDKSKLPVIDEQTQARFDVGHSLEDYAEQLFPNGQYLGFKSYDEYLSLPERTKKALNGKTETIFQGRFEVNNITCIVDVLKRVGDNEYDLIEIKSSAEVKPEHITDLAFQTIVLEDSGLVIRNINVAHINNKYIRSGNIKADELIVISEDISGEVRELLEETRNNIKKALAVISLNKIPDISPRYAGSGSLSDWLPIYENLSGGIDKYSIYNLSYLNTETIANLEDLNIKSINEIPPDFKLKNKRQEFQVEATRSGEQIIDKDEIKEFINTLKYPIHFFDFETIHEAIPLFDGTYPYQQIPFQYSLDILQGPSSALIHKEYLPMEYSNPMPSVIEHMIKDFEGSGSIIVWYKSVEMGRNKEMALLYPEHEKFLLGLNDRIVDLRVPFANNWFVDKDFLGSASIKDILPVITKHNHKKLNISSGGMVGEIWIKTLLEEKSKEKKEQMIKDLLEYCGLDTLAMSEILKVLEDTVK